MLCCMHVEHELRERALEPRKAAHQYNKARARKLRCDFEIHLSEHLTEIEMLLRRESVVGLGTETMMLDVLCCIVAVGHVLKRQVGDLRERVIERVRELLFFRLERRNFGFEARNLCHQCLRRRFLVAFFRRANLARSNISAGKRSFRLLNGAAPALIDGKKLVCLARQTAPRQSAVEFLLMLANPLDVVHVFRRHAPAQAGHPVNTGCLGDLVPDSKAREYWIARMRGRERFKISHSAGLAAALAASLALSAAAFFSTQRTDQIEPS